MFLNRRQGRRQELVKSAQGVRIGGLLLRQARCEHALRFSSQLLESLSQRLQIPFRGVQFRDLALIELLLSGQSDEIRRRLAIGWRKRAQPGADVAELFDLLGQVVDGALRRPDTVRIRLQRTRAFGQRQLDGPHLLAAKFVQQIPAFLPEDFVRDRLDLEAAVSVQRQKRASIEIDSLDRPAVRCEKNRVLLEAPLDCVAVRAVRESRDRHQRPTREICLNQVGTVFGRGRECRRAQIASPRRALIFHCLAPR